MKTLYILRGCPGDGKTTLANSLLLSGVAFDIVAADDMPGLYANGMYQQHLQKDSHDWCKAQVEDLMQREIDIAVHNTFTRIFYIKPYIELAAKYGYAVHIIHSEGVILPDGTRTINTHNVPEDVLTSMRNGWEPFNPVPKLGITIKDIAEQIEKAKAFPDAIIFDMDGTIKRTKSGATFPQTPDDLVFTKEFIDFADAGYNQWTEQSSVYVISNQRGLSGGQKTHQFLFDEWEELLLKLDEAYDIVPTDALFLAKDYILYWAWANGINNRWKEIASGLPKPNTEGFDFIIGTYPEHKNVWIIGDAHTDDRSDDWQFAQNCQKAYPELNIVYIPIELAAHIYKLHHT